VQEADSQMRNALSNVDAAMEFIYKAENEHPNRNDICQASTKAPGSSGGPLVNPSSVGNLVSLQAASDFGQLSSLESKQNLFASQQAFGSPSMLGSTGKFGQPSVLGQKLNPFGSLPAGNGFMQGNSNTTGPFSVFAPKSNPFVTPAQPAIANPFAQNTTSTKNQFTQSKPSHSSFGQSITQPQPSPFGTSMSSPPFGVPSSAAQQNPFGATISSVQGSSSMAGLNQAPPSNPFGQSNQGSGSLGLYSQAAPSPSSNLSGQKPTSLDSLQPNPFAAPNQQVPTQVNGTGVQSPYGPDAPFQHPPLQSYVSKDGSQRLIMFKGNPVVYRENEPGIQKQDGVWEKIWFPDGPPPYYSATELDEDAYTDDIKQAYLYVKETGSFKDGIMPLKPPKREWCLWDF
jgi:nucleoporin NUP42